MAGSALILRSHPRQATFDNRRSGGPADRHQSTIQLGGQRPAVGGEVRVTSLYFVRPDHPDVVRLLSDARDLPVVLADLDPD
jgi:hypothetical protein